MVSARQIVKNMTSMTGAFVGRKFLTLIYFTLIARFTSVEITGIYSYLVAFASISAALLDFGLSTTLIREASRNREKLASYLNSILGLKAILCLTAGVLGISLMKILGYPTLAQQLVSIVIVMMAVEMFADTFYACLRVHHRMGYEAFGMVIGQFITLVLGAISIWLEWPIHFLFYALLANQLFNCGYSLVQVNKQLQIRPRFALDRGILKPFVFVSLPLLVSILVRQIFSADMMLLSWLTDKKIVGLFSIPAVLIGALQFIPVAIVTVTFPALSAFHEQAFEKLRRLYRATHDMLLALTVPMAIVITAFGREIIELTFGTRYAESTLTFQILGWSLIPMFLSCSTGGLLDACKHQIHNMIIVGISLIVHIGMSVLMIPHWQGTGIAFAFLAGHLFAFVVSLFWVFKILDLSLVRFLFDNARVALAGCFMALSLLILKEHLRFVLIAPTGIFVYLLSLAVFKGMTRNGFDKERSYGNWWALAKQVFS